MEAAAPFSLWLSAFAPPLFVTWNIIRALFVPMRLGQNQISLSNGCYPFLAKYSLVPGAFQLPKSLLHTLTVGTKASVFFLFWKPVLWSWRWKMTVSLLVAGKGSCTFIFFFSLVPSLQSPFGLLQEWTHGLKERPSQTDRGHPKTFQPPKPISISINQTGRVTLPSRTRNSGANTQPDSSRVNSESKLKGLKLCKNNRHFYRPLSCSP